MARQVKAEDLYGLRFVSDPQVSPDGHTAAAVVTDVVHGEDGAPPRSARSAPPTRRCTSPAARTAGS